MTDIRIEKFETNSCTEYLVKAVTVTLAVVAKVENDWQVFAVKTKRNITNQLKNNSLDELLEELKNTPASVFLSQGDDVYYIQILSDLGAIYYLSKNSVVGMTYQCADSLRSALFMSKTDAEIMMSKLQFNKDKLHMKFQCEKFEWATMEKLDQDFPEVRNSSENKKVTPVNGGRMTLEQWFETNMDDGYGKPFKNFDEAEKAQILKDAEEILEKDGVYTLRDKYVAYGGTKSVFIENIE